MDLNDLAKNPDQIKSLIGVLQGLLDIAQQNNQSNEIQEETKEEPVLNSKIKTKGSRKISKEKTLNKFEKMSEYRMHKDDVQIDKTLAKHPPVSRMREFEMVDVVCRICGKKETINPSILYDSKSRYKCNNCSTQAG